MIIGLTGVARSGKDTAYDLFEEEFAKHGFKTVRFALADELKSDLDNFLKDKVGISAHTEDTKEKDIIRPLLVGYGAVMRTKSKGKYWTNKIEEGVIHSEARGEIPIITDLRYALHPEDENFWIKGKMKGKVIHISRYNLDEDTGAKRFIQPANEHEAYFDPIFRGISDCRLEWPTVLNGRPDDHDLHDRLRSYIKILTDNLIKDGSLKL